MRERMLSDEHLKKITKYRDDNNIPSFPISKPAEFDKFVELVRLSGNFDESVSSSQDKEQTDAKIFV